MQDIGKLLLIGGLLIAFVGLLLWLGRIPQLPGDILIEKENFRFYFPLATSLLLSLLLSVLLWLLRR